MKKLIPLLFLLLPLVGLAQNQGNIWYFGDHAGLDFNGGSPVGLSDGETYLVYLGPGGVGGHNEGTATIADSSGSLLFYTNGEVIWDRMHQVMPNGDSIMGGVSSSQSAIIVPQPGNSRYFYTFTTDAFFGAGHNLIRGFRYSVVDMCLNDGYGDVIENQKNVWLLDTVAEKLTAVNHSNETDYWVITHKFYSDAFYAYLLTANGVSGPVVSHVGSIHPHPLGSNPATSQTIGQMKASPNGEKLVVVSGNSDYNIGEYFDFNPSTGVVSNPVDFHWDHSQMLYGASFSPDNSKFYVSYTTLSALNGVYQYDLTAGSGDPNAVVASRVQITNNDNIPYLGMQLAVDGKVYISNKLDSYISVINEPNLPGLACGYVWNQFMFGQTNTESYGMPNFIDSYNYHNTIYVPEGGPGAYDCSLITEVEESEHDELQLYPNPTASHIRIQLPENNLKAKRTSLYDMTGRLVHQQPFNPNMDVSHLDRGTYVLVVETEEGNFRGTIQKH